MILYIFLIAYQPDLIIFDPYYNINIFIIVLDRKVKTFQQGKMEEENNYITVALKKRVFSGNVKRM